MNKMIKVGYVTADALKQFKAGVSATFPETIIKSLSGCDIVISTFHVFSPVTFKNEIEGRGEQLVEMGRLSKSLDSVLLVGVETDNYGIKRQSIVSCYDGRLLGISDVTRVKKGSCSSSADYKIYNTPKGKIGVLVGNDICFCEAVKTLSDCECDIIVSLCEEELEISPEILAEALSFMFGITIVMGFQKKIVFASPKSEVVTISHKDVGSHLLQIKRYYREITYKSRGF